MRKGYQAAWVKYDKLDLRNDAYINMDKRDQKNGVYMTLVPCVITVWEIVQILNLVVWHFLYFSIAIQYRQMSWPMQNR